jgi:thiol:disulfide interchange protein DsbA
MKRYFPWLFVLMFLPMGALFADEPSYSEGIDYAVIADPQPVADDGTVEVVELFWYGCPHCYDFEPYLKGWLKTKPAKVKFVRIPAIFNNPLWQLHATAFYTAEVLGIGDKIHDDLFNAIHRDGKPMRTREELADFFAKYGVSKEEFNNTFDSFTVQVKVQRAADLTRKYEITGVPSLIVNGKYRLMGATFEDNLKILDYLVKKELKSAAVARKQ